MYTIYTIHGPIITITECTIFVISNKNDDTLTSKVIQSLKWSSHGRDGRIQNEKGRVQYY